LYLNRTHPLVEGLASYVIDSTLDPLSAGPGRRCGVIRTRAVSVRTTLLLVRFRYHIISRRTDGERPLLAEDCQVLAFEGAATRAKWLPLGQIEALLVAEPDANVSPEQAIQFLRRTAADHETLKEHLGTVATERKEALLQAHRRVRSAARQTGVRYTIEAHEPDTLGIYVLLPGGQA